MIWLYLSLAGSAVFVLLWSFVLRGAKSTKERDMNISSLVCGFCGERLWFSPKRGWFCQVCGYEEGESHEN